MATLIHLRHKDSGIVKKAYYGYSWTTLFFGFWPPLFRGDFLMFLVAFVVNIILAALTYGIGNLLYGFVFGFFYNRLHARSLLERGYVLAGSHAENALAASALGVSNATT